MECRLRAWRMEDAPELALLLNKRAIMVIVLYVIQ